MSKLNRPTSINEQILSRLDVTANYEGGIAFTQSPELRLYRMACTSMFGEDKFYQTAKEHDSEFLQTISEIADTTYVLKLAKYVRNDMDLRTVPVVLLAEATNKIVNLRKSSLLTEFIPIRQYAPQILKRVDDCTECLAYYLGKYGKPIPNSLKRGIADALSNFDEYQLAKYCSKYKEVKLRDVIRLCGRHLIKEGNSFHKAVEGTLRSEGTWEVEVSAKGNNKETWENILPRMGVMAILRNLRNMLKTGVDIEKIKEKFTEQAILDSKQLPFRWYSAWKAILSSIGFISVSYNLAGSKLLDILENAMTISCNNLPKLSGTTAIFVDHSRSMNKNLLNCSKVQYFECGAVLGSIAQYVCEKSIVGLFGEMVKIVYLRKQAGILNNADILKKTDVGHATNAWKCINLLNTEKANVDRIIILTDGQVYNTDGQVYNTEAQKGALLYSELIKYRRLINPKVKTYILDMAGYSMACTPEDDNGVTQIAGWSDRIFDFINAIEADEKTLFDIMEGKNHEQN